MKFVYFGYDFMLEAVRRLQGEGHKLIGIFTFECDNIFTFNRETIALAKELKIPVSIQKPRQDEIDFFKAQACECFLAAGYPYKIPVPEGFGINVHPSLLPKGRGLMPTPHIIINHPEASGFTVHKLAAKFDEGDILYQEALPLSDSETVETLSARIQARVPEILPEIFSGLKRYWDNARPQDHTQASYFSVPDESMRVLDWSKNVNEIDRTARAFGKFGSMARVNGEILVVFSHSIQKASHNHVPGAVVAMLPLTVAANDGFVVLQEFQKLN